MSSKVPVRLSDRLGGWVEKALAKHAAGEPTVYDVGIQLVPEQPGAFVHVFLVSMQGAIVGQWDTLALPMSQANMATEEGVDGFVRNAVEALQTKRSSDLSSQLGVNGTKPGGAS